MFNIIKNTTKILFKRKSFFITTFILPIIIVWGFSNLYSSGSLISVGIINKDDGKFGQEIENRLEKLENIELSEVEDVDHTQDLIYHKYEIIINIGENFTEDIINGKKGDISYDALNKSEASSSISMMIEDEVSSLASICNNVDVKTEGEDKVLDTFKDSRPDCKFENEVNKKVSINQSLGIVLYVLFVSAATSCVFLLEDESEGTKERILMGKVSEKQYYGAQCLVFAFFASIPGIEYYIMCNVLNYEFGFDNKIALLLLILLMSIFAVVFAIMMISLVKNRSLVVTMISTVIVPVFMLSGAFWNFDMMSSSLQKIGNMFPPRWVVMAVENLQEGKAISSIIPMVVGLVAISIFAFLLSVFFTRNKIVLIKGNK